MASVSAPLSFTARLRRLLPICACGVLLALPSAASAARPRLSVEPARALSFGSFVVFSQGSRTVSATGEITGVGIEPAGDDTAFPASFTVSYDRGNESRRPISLLIELQLLRPSQVSAGGLVGSLAGFTSDLPGSPVISPGQLISLSIDNCTTRTCSRSFRIGARLDVRRNYGGGPISIPLTVTAALIALD